MNSVDIFCCPCEAVIGLNLFVEWDAIACLQEKYIHINSDHVYSVNTFSVNSNPCARKLNEARVYRIRMYFVQRHVIGTLKCPKKTKKKIQNPGKKDHFLFLFSPHYYFTMCLEYVVTFFTETSGLTLFLKYCTYSILLYTIN